MIVSRPVVPIRPPEIMQGYWFIVYGKYLVFGGMKIHFWIIRSKPGYYVDWVQFWMSFQIEKCLAADIRGDTIDVTPPPIYILGVGQSGHVRQHESIVHVVAAQAFAGLRDEAQRTSLQVVGQFDRTVEEYIGVKQANVAGFLGYEFFPRIASRIKSGAVSVAPNALIVEHGAGFLDSIAAGYQVWVFLNVESGDFELPADGFDSSVLVYPVKLAVVKYRERKVFLQILLERMHLQLDEVRTVAGKGENFEH